MSPVRFEVIPLDHVPSRSDSPNEKEAPVVLVVDDERVIADTLSIILEKNGFKVLTAYDGEMALEISTAVHPQLLVSDVMMGPGMDGVELAIAVKNTEPDCKVLLFSGHAAARDLLQNASVMGDFTLLNKPVHPADLLDHIHQKFGIETAAARA